MFTFKKNILEYFGTPPARSETEFGLEQTFKFPKMFKNVFLLAESIKATVPQFLCKKVDLLDCTKFSTKI